MNRVRRTGTRAALLLTACLATLPAGCSGGPPPSRLKFNDKLARNVRKIFLKAQATGKEIDRLRTEGAATGGLEQNLRELQDLIADLKAKAKDQSLPGKSTEFARDVLDCYIAFLDSQEKLLDNYRTIINELVKGKGANLAVIEAQLKIIDDVESTSYGKLSAAQDRYAKECNFSLVDKKSS